MRNFLKNIVNAESNESSKRLIALWFTLLVSIIVVFTLIKPAVAQDVLNIFYGLLGIIGTLVGVSTGESVWKHISNNRVKREGEKEPKA